MFSANSIDVFAKKYKHDGHIVCGGMWSMLLSNSAEQSAEFARRHLETFNKVVHGSWHLAVCAENDSGIWLPSQKYQQMIENIRENLESERKNIPNLGIIFFDPNEGSFNKKSLIIPLDETRLGNVNHYEQGFRLTHECIVKSFEKCKIDQYKPISSENYKSIISELNKNLIIKRVNNKTIPILKSLSEVLLGAFIGSSISK